MAPRSGLVVHVKQEITDLLVVVDQVAARIGVFLYNLLDQGQTSHGQIDFAAFGAESSASAKSVSGFARRLRLLHQQRPFPCC